MPANPAVAAFSLRKTLVVQRSSKKMMNRLAEMRLKKEKTRRARRRWKAAIRFAKMRVSLAHKGDMSKKVKAGETVAEKLMAAQERAQRAEEKASRIEQRVGDLERVTAARYAATVEDSRRESRLLLQCAAMLQPAAGDARPSLDDAPFPTTDALQTCVEKLATEATKARNAYVAMGHMDQASDDASKPARRGTFMVGELLKKSHQERDDKQAAKHRTFLEAIAEGARAALTAESVADYVSSSGAAAAAGVDLGLDYFVPGAADEARDTADGEEHRRAKLSSGMARSSGEMARLISAVVVAALDVEMCLRSRDLWIAHGKTTFDVAPSLLKIAADAAEALTLAREAKEKAAAASSWREALQALEAALEKRVADVAETAAALRAQLESEVDARKVAEEDAERKKLEDEARRAEEDAARAKLAEEEAKKALEMEEKAEAARRASIEAAKLASLLAKGAAAKGKDEKDAKDDAPAEPATDGADSGALWDALELKADKLALARLRLELRQLQSQMAGDGAMAVTQKRSFSARFPGALGARAREGYTLRDGVEICLSCHRPGSPRRPSTPSLEKVEVERRLARGGAPTGRGRAVVRPKSASANRRGGGGGPELTLLRSASGALSDPRVAAQFGPTGAHPDAFRRPRTASDKGRGAPLRGREWPAEDQRLDGTYPPGYDPHDTVHRFNEGLPSRKVVMPRTNGSPDVVLKSATLGTPNQFLGHAPGLPNQVQFTGSPPLTSLQHSPGFTPSPIHRDATAHSANARYS